MNEKKVIQTNSAPQAIGPYSQAIQVGSMIFTSGQIPLNKDGELIEGGIKEQTTQVIQNLQAVLDAAGCTLADVIKTTVFIKDMNEFAQLNETYEEFFGQSKPARSTVEVARLPKDVRVEIECIALLK
jgi:2-iminobutanoate/2-iminopropanoate deaminase